MLTVSYGSSTAWAGPNFKILTTDETPFESGPMSKSEAALVVSMPCFGAIIGSLLYTMIIDRFSRRVLLVSIAIPEIVSIIDLVRSVETRVTINKFQQSKPVNFSTVDKVRGTLGSMLILFANAGCLFGFTISLFLDYSAQLKANLLFPILFLVAFYYFPETPEFLSKQNLKEEAKKSLEFYGGIVDALPEETEKMKETEKIYEEDENEDSGLSLSDFCTKAAKKAILISLFLGVMNQFCGAFTLLSYANKIFAASGSKLSEDVLAVIVGIAQLAANVITMLLVDRLGRKLLVTTSAMGTAISLFGMGAYDIYKDNLTDYTWIPVVTFSMAIFMASIGMLPLTFVLLSEILPKKIRSIVTLCSLEIVWILAFTLMTIYPTFVEMIGSHNIEFAFGSCCIIGTLFYLTVLPETGGKSYDEIMRALEK